MGTQSTDHSLHAQHSGSANFNGWFGGKLFGRAVISLNCGGFQGLYVLALPEHVELAAVLP